MRSRLLKPKSVPKMGTRLLPIYLLAALAAGAIAGSLGTLYLVPPVQLPHTYERDASAIVFQACGISRFVVGFYQRDTEHIDFAFFVDEVTEGDPAVLLAEQGFRINVVELGNGCVGS